MIFNPATAPGGGSYFLPFFETAARSFNPATVAVQRETRTIPIVFGNVADPVSSGVVARLDRPSGNTTGFSNWEASMGGKWLELLSEIAPGLKRAAMMFNPDINPVSLYFMPSFETAARSLKVEAITAPVHDDVEIETAIIALGREPGGGLVVTADAFVIAHRAPIILAAARNNVPAVYIASDLARDGGLLSYGPDGVDILPGPKLRQTQLESTFLWAALHRPASGDPGRTGMICATRARTCHPTQTGNRGQARSGLPSHFPVYIIRIGKARSADKCDSKRSLASRGSLSYAPLHALCATQADRFFGGD